MDKFSISESSNKGKLTIINFSGRLGFGFNTHEKSLVDALSTLIKVKPNSHILFDLEEVSFLYPSGINGLVTIGKYLMHSRNCKITQKSPRDPDVRAYLDRVGFSIVGISPLQIFGKNSTIDNATVFKIQNFTKVDEDAIDNLISVIETELNISLSVRNRIHDNIAELIMNVLYHSNSPMPCTIIGQAYPKTHRIRYCICDMGMGIKKHITKKYKEKEEEKTSEVIEFATQYGITGTLDSDLTKRNSGFGLDDMRRLVNCCGGSCLIISGNGLFEEQVEYSTVNSDPMIRSRKEDLKLYFHGTLIDIVLQATPGFTVIHKTDQVSNLLMRDPPEQHIEIEISKFIGADCSERRTTLSAKGGDILRQRILEEIAVGNRVCLSFSNVRRATPSFIDEAIGKLALYFEMSKLKEYLFLKNISDEIIMERIDGSLVLRAKQFFESHNKI